MVDFVYPPEAEDVVAKFPFEVFDFSKTIDLYIDRIKRIILSGTVRLDEYNRSNGSANLIENERRRIIENIFYWKFGEEILNDLSSENEGRQTILLLRSLAFRIKVEQQQNEATARLILGCGCKLRIHITSWVIREQMNRIGVFRNMTEHEFIVNHRRIERFVNGNLNTYSELDMSVDSDEK